jgi:phenylpyruvate tautomerase PptA (4-oxalocrotonate tautomerase family)
MIEPIMPYANIDIFREKGAKIKKKRLFSVVI